MKQFKKCICLFAVLVVLTLTACQPNAEQVVGATQTVSPTVGVEATFLPSGQPSAEPTASAEPTQTQPPTQSQDKGESTPVTTQAPVSTPKPKPNPTPAPTPQPTPKASTCYLSIECKTILSRMEDLTPGKEGLVPGNGVILGRTALSFQEGESVFDVLLRATQSYGIHMEYSYTPGFGSHYIEGINNLYEFDCGAGSGWMYYVNGVKPNYGVSKYTVQDGDVIEFKYICDLGFDL